MEKSTLSKENVRSEEEAIDYMKAEYYNWRVER